jgi:hypothetical protein
MRGRPGADTHEMNSFFDRLAAYFGLRGDPRPFPAEELPAHAGTQEEHDLGALLSNAPPVPLTDEVRVNPKEFSTRLVWEMDRAEGSDTTREAAAGLQELVDKGKPIPMTDQVRLDGRKAARLLSQLRGTAASS